MLIPWIPPQLEPAAMVRHRSHWQARTSPQRSARVSGSPHIEHQTGTPWPGSLSRGRRGAFIATYAIQYCHRLFKVVKFAS